MHKDIHGWAPGTGEIIPAVIARTDSRAPSLEVQARRIIKDGYERGHVEGWLAYAASFSPTSLDSALYRLTLELMG